MTSSVSGNAIYRSCFRILALSCYARSTLVRWCPSLSAAIVTQLVTRLRLAAQTDPLLVRYVQLVAWRRLPGNWTLDPSYSVGLIPMLLWSTLVVNLLATHQSALPLRRSLTQGQPARTQVGDRSRCPWVTAVFPLVPARMWRMPISSMNASSRLRRRFVGSSAASWELDDQARLLVRAWSTSPSYADHK